MGSYSPTPSLPQGSSASITTETPEICRTPATAKASDRWRPVNTGQEQEKQGAAAATVCLRREVSAKYAWARARVMSSNSHGWSRPLRKTLRRVHAQGHALSAPDVCQRPLPQPWWLQHGPEDGSRQRADRYGSATALATLALHAEPAAGWRYARSCRPTTAGPQQLTSMSQMMHMLQPRVQIEARPLTLL
jgi:hypothetical protein